MAIPKDPIMLLSYVNMQLRDHYPSLEEFARANNLDAKEIQEKLQSVGYEYNEALNQFR